MNKQSSVNASAPLTGSALWLWEIVKLVQDQKDVTKKLKVSEFVTAYRIEWVWDYLALDRADEGVEIQSIVRAAPIVAQLVAPEPERTKEPLPYAGP